MITTKIQRPVSFWELCDPWLERLGLLLTKIQNPVSLLILIAALCLFAGVFLSAVGAQEKKPNFMRVEGHVYEPAKVEPTDERIHQLKLPTGFRIARFAEMVNPRMIAVAPAGTVYVTARELGTLVMLRDANQAGVADVKPDGTLGELRTLISDLPDGGQHPNRTLAIGPDQMLCISIGSTCNACRRSAALLSLSSLRTRHATHTAERFQPPGAAQRVAWPRRRLWRDRWHLSTTATGPTLTIGREKLNRDRSI